MSISIRPAVAGDGATLARMIRALAVHHGYEAYFSAQPEDYEKFLADPHAINGALIACWNGEPAGCATWQRSYSTFIGRETIYMEDISVLPEFRRKGIGSALLKAMARFALDRGSPRLHWLLMAWNNDARRLYAEAGAVIEDGNCHCILEGAALERLAS